MKELFDALPTAAVILFCGWVLYMTAKRLRDFFQSPEDHGALYTILKPLGIIVAGLLSAFIGGCLVMLFSPLIVVILFRAYTETMNFLSGLFSWL